MRLFPLIYIGLLFIVNPALASNCEYSFQVDNGAKYPEEDISHFIEKEIRSRLSRISQNFTTSIYRRCGNGPEKNLRFGMNSVALYIQTINGVTLDEDVERYTNDNLVLSKATIDKLFEKALMFASLPKKDQQHVVKMFAYVIAESARFEDIENAVNKLLTSNCRYQWSQYKDLVRRWKTMSIFANSRGLFKGEPYFGGYQAFLIAPITSEMVKDYNMAVTEQHWKVVRGKYGEPRVIDKAAPIPVGKAVCNF